MPVMPEELDDDYAIGERLREERERLGLKVHELAHLCGCVDLVQQRYEAGTQPIPADYLHALHRRTDVRVMWVIAGHDAPKTTG